jgi:hypothetical protein
VRAESDGGKHTGTDNVMRPIEGPARLAASPTNQQHVDHRPMVPARK